MMTRVCRSIPTRALYRHLETQWRTLQHLILAGLLFCVAALLSFFLYVRLAASVYQFRATAALVEVGVMLVFLAVNAGLLTREIRLSRQEWVQRVNALVRRIFRCDASDLHAVPFSITDSDCVDSAGAIHPTLTPPSPVAAGKALASPPAPASRASTTAYPEPADGAAFCLPTVQPVTEGGVHLGDNANGHALAKTPLNASVSAYSVIRDHELLLVPSALLCQGDYIVLDFGGSLPGDATYVGTWLNQTTVTDSYLVPYAASVGSDPRLRAGQIFTAAFLRTRGIPALAVPNDQLGAEPGRLLSCQHVFRLDVTPFADDLRSALAYEGCPNSVLDNQIVGVCRFLVHRVLFVCLGLAFAANSLRYALLDTTHHPAVPTLSAPDVPWGQGALEYLAAYQVYVLLPFCGLALPVLTVLARTYANAQILILLDALQRSKTDYEDADDIDEFDMEAPPPTKDITVPRAAVWRKFLQLLARSDFRNLSRSNRLVESLGNTTVICAVDRDGTVARSFPAVDQILFINPANTMISVDVVEDKIYSNGVAFEENGWERHLASLKPLGLNFLLNSNCGASAGRYRLDPHKRSNPLQGFCKIDAAQQTCLCRIGHEIGFTTEALTSFTKHEQISVTAPYHPSVPVLASLQDPAVPSMVSTVYEEGRSGSYQLLSDGQVPLVLDLCSDFWDGEQIRPLTLAMKQEILELYQNALENDIQTVAFAYRPLDPCDLPGPGDPARVPPRRAHRAVCLELGPEDHQHSSWRWIYRQPAQPADSPASEVSGAPASPDLHSPASPGLAPLSAGLSTPESEVAGTPAVNTDSAGWPSDPLPPRPVDLAGVHFTAAGRPYRTLVRDQIFLGLTTLCHVPKVDVCDVIEDLGLAGIRFVYFSQARERESKAFAERLGLATDWNSCILLSSDRPPGGTGLAAMSGALAGDGGGDDADLSGDQTGGDLTAFLPTGYLEDHDIKTQLPRGIANIRPHLADVDDIPLQVSLFAEADWEAIREMFRIYQEEGEVVCCIGSGLKASNPMNFATADFGIAIDPFPMGFRGMYRDDRSELSSPLVGLRDPRDVATSFLIGAGLISLPCSLAFQYDTSLYVLTQIIQEGRWLLACIRQGGCFLIGVHLASVFAILLSYTLLLPPILLGFHILWILCFLVPLLGLPFLFTEHEPDIMTTMLAKNRIEAHNITRLFRYAVASFVPPVCLCVLTYLIALQALLGTGYHDLYTHFIRINWAALTRDSQWAVLYAQTLSSCVFVYYMVVLSASFLYRVHSIVDRPPWRNPCWPWTAATCLILQCAFATATLATGPADLIRRVPWYYYVVALASPLILVPYQEFVKWHDRRHWTLFQKRSKLEFNTKLGLHSPI
ncbi:hypothetical protein IWQ60_010099 [Tieghemiomyces parasiticus]|uniref:Cation-transporting P-type ATPase C-terminal domain-containing protein n=1 Tax=Tieghemiomyces parasiticus TaxID=78921 RepID=A0A9W7ZKT0_9FUNG|nr:hypothetical protein IWQ60_010099 [Tieghemiomyces parasiticus]